MKTGKIIRYVILVLLAAGILVYFYNESRKGSDFNVFLQAAQQLLHGKNIYTIWFRVNSSGLLYFYSPLFALTMVPFSFLPPAITNFLWLLADVFFLYRIAIILAKISGADLLRNKQLYILASFSFLLTARFLIYNFDLVQMTIFLLYASLESIYFFHRGKKIPGAILLALAINIKILPLILIPYLIFRKKFTESALTVLFTATTLILPAIFLGFRYNTFLLSEWWASIDPLKADHTSGEVHLGLHSLSALVTGLFTNSVDKVEIKRYIAILAPETISYLINGLRAFFILLSLVFLRYIPFRKAKSDLHSLWELSYLFTITPLIFPHQQKYAFFYLLPACFYIVFFLIKANADGQKPVSKRRIYLIWGLMILVFALTTLTTDGLIGRELNNITQHFKLITYGTILLIIPLGLSNPKYLQAT